MPSIYMLIGVPGSGKSTWRENYLKNNDAVVISSDDHVDDFAEKNGVTYTQAFGMVDMKDIEAKIRSDYMDAITSGKDIIVDRTNMSRKSRSRFLSFLPDGYEKHAIVFQCPEEELQRRLTKRAEETGKSISDAVIQSMQRNYQEPTLSEFDDVQFIRSDMAEAIRSSATALHRVGGIDDETLADLNTR